MIELHTYRAGFGQPTATPFGVKTIILLKMAEQPFEIVYKDDPRKAPKGKLPIIVDDGVTVADSSFIRKHLEKKYGIDFDPGLSPVEKSGSLAFQRLTEEHLYWAAAAARWVDDDNWRVLREGYFVAIPGLIRPLIAGQVRKQVRRDMHGHGMGRHTLDDQYGLAVDNLAAISDWLGEKPFMHGETPTAIDASVGAFISTIHDDGFDTPIRQTVRDSANLAGYAARIKARYIQDV
jgi:glutathione S-transferase